MDSYGAVNPNNNPPLGFQPNVRLAYGTADGAAVYRPVMPPPYQVGGGNGSSAPPTKKKRGRPRKYDADGGAGTVSPLPQPQPTPTDVGFQPIGGDGAVEGGGQIQERRKNLGRPRKNAVKEGCSVSAVELEAIYQASGLSSPSSPAIMGTHSGKKTIGRPKGAKGRKQSQQVASMGPAGLGFTPHVILVQAGEDISNKIMLFSENFTKGFCVLSANGTLSNVALRQVATSGGSVPYGGSVTYEGRFEIVSLHGSFVLVESGGQRSRAGGLSVVLAGPDGRVFGGGVAGVLTAATPVQLVVGCFVSGQEDFKLPTQAGQEEIKSPTAGQEDMKSPGQAGPSTAPPNLVPGASAAGSPISWGTMSDSSGGAGSPLNQNTGAYDNGINQQGMNSLSWLN